MGRLIQLLDHHEEMNGKIEREGKRDREGTIVGG